MSDNLPEELLIEILLRVPVKSLVRFTLVSKSWNALITSPSFIMTHLTRIQQQSDPTSLRLLRRYSNFDKKEHYTLHPDHEDGGEDDNGGDSFVVKSTELFFPFNSIIGYFRIVGSCNGLVCLSDDLFGATKPIILWNPSIRKSVSSPSPTIKPPLPYMFVLGFGVDSHKEYKVVRVVYHKVGEFEYMVPPEVEVYTLSVGSWRRITDVGVRFYIADFMWSQAFVNGFVHWIAYQPRGNGNSSLLRILIIAFGMDNEKFNEIMLPDALANEIATNLVITTYGNSLTVIKYRVEIGHTYCEIWVMEKYGVVESWTRMYSIQFGSGMDKVVGFRRNGDILVSSGSNKLVIYDPKTCDIKQLGILGSPRSFYVNSFSETLVLLKRQNVIVEEEQETDDVHSLHWQS